MLDPNDAQIDLTVLENLTEDELKELLGHVTKEVENRLQESNEMPHLSIKSKIRWGRTIR